MNKYKKSEIIYISTESTTQRIFCIFGMLYFKGTIIEIGAIEFKSSTCMTRVTIVGRASTEPLSHITTEFAFKFYEVFSMLLAVTHTWNARCTD
jgi:hypothetical protein